MTRAVAVVRPDDGCDYVLYDVTATTRGGSRSVLARVRGRRTADGSADLPDDARETVRDWARRLSSAGVDIVLFPSADDRAPNVWD